MVVVSLSIPDELLADLDTVLGEGRSASRSEVIRQALRNYISEYRELSEMRGVVIATITVLYDKEEKNDGHLGLQHEFGEIITSYLHSHLSDDSCLEVMVIKGDASRLKQLIDGLKADLHLKNMKFSVMVEG